MSLDLTARCIHGLGQAGHLKDRLLVPGWCHDIRRGLVLNALDGGALGADDQADHSVGNAHLDCHLAGDVRRRPGGRQRPCGAAEAGQVVLSRCSDLGEVLGGGENLSLGFGDVLLAARHHEHGFFATNGRFDVGVGLGAESLDLAALPADDFGDMLRTRHRHALRHILTLLAPGFLRESRGDDDRIQAVRNTSNVVMVAGQIQTR